MGAKSDFTCLGGFPGALVQDAFELTVLSRVTKEFRTPRTGMVRSNIPINPEADVVYPHPPGFLHRLL
jgi:hypothetical protein